MWDDFRSLISDKETFLISSHLSLDGDSVGSQIAMRWYLESLGKKVTVFNCDSVPRKFAFLSGADTFRTELPGELFDVVVVLDCSNPRRLGWDLMANVPLIANIDHHRDNTCFGKVNIVDNHAAATGEIIYRFFSNSDIAYPPFVAQALYAAIMTDTGGFRFSNTNSTILRICSELVDRGADCSNIYERIYASHSPEGLMLQSRIWASLKYHLDGTVCSMEMPMSILDELGARYSDSEGMADHTITAEGVEVGMMIKYTDTESHFSLRSKGAVDVGRIAQKIPGGGGHFSAAGCTVTRPFSEAFPYMLDILRQELG